MSKVNNEHGNFKTRAPWFKCFPTDWLEGTRELTPEQRGVYIDCLCMIYRDDKPLPDNGPDGEKRMAFALHISTRLWRSIRKALINSGKLIETPEGLINVRAQVEIDSRSVQPPTKSESASKNEKKPMVSTCAGARSQTSESDNRKETPFTPEDHEKVKLIDGKPVLFNGLRQFWLDQFGGDAQRLDLALIEAAAYVQPNGSKPLEAQVSAQLARKAADKRDRDARYAAAAKKSEQPSATSFKSSPPRPLPRDEAAEDAAIQARVKAMVDAACAGARP